MRKILLPAFVFAPLVPYLRISLTGKIAWPGFSSFQQTVTDTKLPD